MSSVSQTQPRTPAGFRRYFGVGLLVVAVVLAIALAPVWRYVAHAAATAHPHWLDVALFRRLPLAIKLHIFGAVGALLVGAVLMWVRKGRTFHRTAGWVWVSLVSLVVGSSLFINGLNNGKFSVLHVFTAWTLITLPLAVMWAKRHEVQRHRRMMMGLFYGGFAVNMFIAFIPGRTMWNLFFG